MTPRLRGVLRLLRWPIDRLVFWYRYRNVDHFELRWRPPNGRGWRQIEKHDDEFDPSDLDEPFPIENFGPTATAFGWYQGEYRLVGITEDNQFCPTVWQRWFHAGPILQEERAKEQRRQERFQEIVEKNKEILRSPNDQ